MKAQRVFSLVWAVTCFRNGLCQASEEILQSNPALGRYVQELLNEFHVPGLSVAVVDLKQSKSGQISAKGYGFARLPSTPATPDTLYYAGSTTKAFTAAAAAKIVQNDTALDWNTPIHDLLPWFKLENEYATRHTTIEDALSHRSGLAAHAFAYRPGSPTALTHSLRWMPLTAEPRVRWQYCNLMYGVVANVLETITRSNLGTLISHHFWRPLGMESTFFSLSDALNAAEGNKKMSRGYWWADCNDSNFGPDPSCGPEDQGYYIPESYIDLTGHAGAGAIISSVNDYALWIRGILQSGLSEEWLNKSSPLVDIIRSVVRPRSILPAELLVPTPELLINPPNYALGWINSMFSGRTVISHSGGVPGYVTEVFILPEEGLGVVTLANAAGDGSIVGNLVVLAILQDKLNMLEAEIEQETLRVRESGSFLGLSGPQPPSGDEETSGTTPIVRWKPWYKSRMEQDPAFNYNSFHRDQYYHPAYGTFTVTEHILSEFQFCKHRVQKPTSQKPFKTQTGKPLIEHNAEPERFLIVEPSPHILNYAIYLLPKPQSPDGSIRFDGMIINLHGDCASHFNNSHLRRAVKPPHNEEEDHQKRCAGSGTWQINLAYLEPGPDHFSERFGFALEPEMARYAAERARTKRAVLTNALRESRDDAITEELKELDDTVVKNGMIWFDRIEDHMFAPQRHESDTREEEEYPGQRSLQ